MAEHMWYVLRVVAGQEKKTKNYLDNEIQRQNIGEFIPEVLIPS